jgi:hypothetical protein
MRCNRKTRGGGARRRTEALGIELLADSANAAVAGAPQLQALVQSLPQRNGIRSRRRLR